MTTKKDVADAPAPAKPKRPTREQLQQIQSGGDYVFNSQTGELTQTRQPAKPQTKGGK